LSALQRLSNAWAKGWTSDRTGQLSDEITERLSELTLWRKRAAPIPIDEDLDPRKAGSNSNIDSRIDTLVNNPLFTDLIAQWKEHEKTKLHNSLVKEMDQALAEYHETNWKSSKWESVMDRLKRQPHNTEYTLQLQQLDSEVNICILEHACCLLRPTLETSQPITEPLKEPHHPGSNQAGSSCQVESL